MLHTIAIILITLGIEWFIRKYKNQIQIKFSKYVYWILTSIFLFLFGILIGTLINSKGEELGSWADWVSGIGTIGAFIWGIIAITKQTNIQRALDIESQRPQFSFERTMNIQKGELVLRPDIEGDTTPKKIKDRLNNNEGFLFRLTNISENPIYSMKVILDYNFDRENVYAFHGMPKESSIVLVPTKFIKNWQEILVKFRSSAGETGYIYCMAGNSATYYFVKDKNAAVSTYGNDKLISQNDEIIQLFDEKFEDSKSSSVMFKANRSIRKEDK